jgi:hypothetical protein
MVFLEWVSVVVGCIKQAGVAGAALEARVAAGQL